MEFLNFSLNFSVFGKNVFFPIRSYLTLFFIWATDFRSSCSEVFCRKAVFRNFAKFTGKHLCQSLFFNKVAGLTLRWQIAKQLSGSTLFYQATIKTRLKKMEFFLCNKHKVAVEPTTRQNVYWKNFEITDRKYQS